MAVLDPGLSRFPEGEGQQLQFPRFRGHTQDCLFGIRDGEDISKVSEASKKR